MAALPFPPLHFPTLTTGVDVVLSALILRALFGWFIRNPRLARFAAFLLLLGAVVVVIERSSLALTQILTAALALPIACLITLHFLPDLRRAYQGGAALRQLFAPQQIAGDNPIPALVAAVLEMARIRCGAILVFPKGDDADAFLVGGEEYDAMVTKSLLLSICHRECPRHDGAIMIRRGRIVRVGAVLPLSNSDAAREEWGTRHLAAIGLSERCDAVVVVVSEERGTVSYARNGEMSELEPLAEDRLTRFFGTILEPRAYRRRTRRARRLSRMAWVAAGALAASGVPLLHWLSRLGLVHR